MGMFDDLIEQHAPSGGMFADLIAEHAPKANAPQGGTPGMPEGVDVPGAMAPEPEPTPQQPANAFAPPESVMPAPVSIADRFKLNAREGFDNTSTGEVINRVQSGRVDQTAADDMFRAIVEARQANSPVGLDVYVPTTEDKASKYPGLHQPQPNPYAGVPLPKLEADFRAASSAAEAKADTFGAKREAQRSEYDALPSFADAPTLKDKAIQGAIALAGEMAGGFAGPENLIGGPGKGFVREAGEGLLKRAAREALPGAIAGAAGGAVAAPAVQSSKAERGEGEGLTGANLGEQVALGAAVGAAFHLPGIIARPILERIAAKRGVPLDRLDPDHVSQQEVHEVISADPDLTKAAQAAGIPMTSAEVEAQARYRAESAASDIHPSEHKVAAIEQGTKEELAAHNPADLAARIKVLEDKLAGRQEADTLRTPDQPAGPLRAQDAEVGRRQGEVQGVTDETINPAATNIIRRTPDETPIRVDREGNAFRADAGALEGRAKAAALQRADTKLLPTPGRAVPTDEEISLQRRQANVSGDNRGSEEITPPKLYGGENRLPEASDGKPTVDYANQKTSTKAAPLDEGGRFATDPNGYVASDKGGPVRFAQEKQADRFASSQGKKTGQDFEVVEHPTGKGFTVRDRAPDAEMSRQIEGDRPIVDDLRSVDVGQPRQIETGRSYDEQVKTERDRLWSEEMPGYKRKPSNEDAVSASARETVMRREAIEQVAAAEQAHGIAKEDVHEVAQLYRRGADEPVQQAWDRAVDRWAEKTEAEARAYENAMGAEDHAHDILREEAGSETLYRDNHRAIHGEEVDHDKIPFDGNDRGASEPHGADGRAAEGERAERSGGDETRGQAEHGRGDAARDTDAGPDGKHQTVIPGAERLTDRALAERQGNKPLRGGDEPPPKDGLFDEDARKQGDIFDPKSTTHAGAIFDPAVWKWFGSKIAGDKYLREMRSLAKDFKEDKADTRGRKTSKAADAARFVFYSVDGQMRALAHAVESPTLKKVADLFYAPADAGRGGAVGQTYHEAVTAQSGRNLNELSKIMERLGDKPSAMDQVVKLVQNPHNIKAGTVVHDAAAAIVKLLADEHKYLSQAGVEVGHVKGYYPREINVASVMKNGDGFRLAAERAYKASGMGAQEAKDAAAQWLQRVVLGGVNIRPEGTDFVHMGGSPSNKFSKGRELSKAADEIMAPFYHRDPLEALTTYFQRTARRAEWARRMGDTVKGPDGKPVFDELGKWKKMKADMIAEGNAAAVRQTVDMIASSVGANSATLPKGADALVGMLKAYGTIKLLTHAAITSASESVLPAIRAGAPHRILTDIPRTVAALWAKSGKLGEQRAFAEDLGLIMRGAGNGILAARYSAIDPASRVRERIMNRNFRMSGLEQWTSATRVMAVNGAEAFIRRLGLDVADSKLRQNSSRKLLAELGVKDIAGFAKWVKDNDGTLKGRDVTAGGHADTYRNAVTRFVHQSIMEVSASTRPQWANHPVGSLIFMLQSYNYAYQKNVTARAGHQIMNAVSRGGGNLADRATMLSPLALIPAMFAIQMGIAPIRNAVFNSAHKKPLSDEDELHNNMIQAASRSVTGAFDPIVQIFTSAKYHSSSENILGGPAVAGIGQLIDAVVAMTPKEAGGTNSDKTNSAERNVTRNIYDSVIAPAIVTAGALSPSWLGALLTQAPSIGVVKDAVIDSVAGAPTTAGGRGRPQRPARK